MHENREISSTPWSDDQGRSAKATNQTADTHVPEKSDCAVLPVNQPNKGGQGTDEGEHRSIAHAPDTEWETHVPGVGRCAEGSKGKKAGTVHRFAPPSQR